MSLSFLLQVLLLSHSLVKSDVIDCAQNQKTELKKIVEDIDKGLSYSQWVFSQIGKVYPDAQLAATAISGAKWLVGFYGKSLSDGQSVWECLDDYLNMVILQIYEDVATFESTSAKQIINDLLKPVYNIANSYKGGSYESDICDVIQYYMNPQSFSGWNLCQELGCISTLDLQYYYLALPYLIQYNNLRFDIMSWLYNESDITICSRINSDFKTNFQLTLFFQDTAELFNMYLATFPYLMYDINTNGILNVTERDYYYATIYSSPSIFCRWLELSFLIYEESTIHNDSDVQFDLTYSDFVGHDFSAFQYDCPAALLSWQMSVYSENICTVPSSYRTGTPAPIPSPAPTDHATMLNLYNCNIIIILCYLCMLY